MGTINPSIPTIGDPNASEDADIRSALITIRDEINGSLDNNNIAAAGTANIAHNKLANATAGQLLIANASGVITATTVTGDVTVSSSGVTAIGNDKISKAMMQDNSVSAAEIENATVTENELSTSVAGNGLAGGGGTPLSVGVDGSTIELSGDQARVKASGIQSSHVAGGTLETGDMATATLNHWLKLASAADRKVSWGVDNIGAPVGVSSGTASVTHNLGTTPIVVIICLAQQSNLAVSASSYGATTFTARWHQTAESAFTGTVTAAWIAIG